MQLSVTGHHIDLTESLRAYVDSKFERLERHFDQLNTAHVVLTVESQEQRAEGSLVGPGLKLHAEARCENMYAAIDALTDKLDRQVRKHKEKSTDHHRAEGGLGARGTDV